MEIFSSEKTTKTEFLVILKPESVDQDYRLETYAAVKHSDHTELQIGQSRLLFFDNNIENPFTFEKRQT